MKTSKKHMLRILVFTLLLLTFLFLCWLFCSFAEELYFREPLPLLQEYNVLWGNRPQKLVKQCEELIEIDENAADTGHTAYSFKMDVLENDAEVMCFYSRIYGLQQVYITWTFDNKNDRDFLAENAKEILNSAYCMNEFYYLKESTNENGEKMITLGINKGATGIHYKILTLDMKLMVSCVVSA